MATGGATQAAYERIQSIFDKSSRKQGAQGAVILWFYDDGFCFAQTYISQGDL